MAKKQQAKPSEGKYQFLMCSPRFGSELKAKIRVISAIQTEGNMSEQMAIFIEEGVQAYEKKHGKIRVI